VSSTTPHPVGTSAPEVAHGDRSRPVLALTFHGNGDPALAEQLLRLLEGRHARGTVLAVGTWLAKNPSMAARITDAGHELGNHTQHHLPMRRLTATHAYTEISACAEELRARTGSIGTWFRASGTQRTTPTIRAAAARAGYARCVSYDVDGLDWQDPPTATVVRAVLSGAKNGSIVSLHLGHPVTIKALPAILDRLPSRGLRPVTLTELLS
jgi:peptidoglycan/xylan/chitin deacetylase (PgdA/CDA1 family)